MKKAVSGILTVLIFCFTDPAAAIEDSAERIADGEMFLLEIGGNRYERKSFEADGALASRAVIDIGMPESHRDSIQIPMTVTVYDAEGKVTNELNSRWICERKGQQMIMPMLFVAETKDSSKRLMITGNPIIYPEAPQDLADLTLTIRSETGILSWLPGKSVVHVTDRHVSRDENPQDGRYTITEKVEVKVVVLGIPFKKIRRSSKETIDAERGLVRHVLEANDGSRSVIRLLPKDDGATTAQVLDAP